MQLLSCGSGSRNIWLMLCVLCTQFVTIVTQNIRGSIVGGSGAATASGSITHSINQPHVHRLSPDSHIKQPPSKDTTPMITTNTIRQQKKQVLTSDSPTSTSPKKIAVNAPSTSSDPLSLSPPPNPQPQSQPKARTVRARRKPKPAPPSEPHVPRIFHDPLSHDEALTRISYPQKGGYFHAYNIHSNKSSDPLCTTYYEEHNASLSTIPTMMKDYKLWSGDWMTSSRLSRNPLTANDTLFGFKHAMDVIYKHQHPIDCSKVQFMIPTEHNGGFGSELHVLINLLGLAIDMNRVLLHNPILQDNSQWEVNVPFCKPNNNNNNTHTTKNSLGFDCYYEPWSSCTIYDALGPLALEKLKDIRKAKYTSLTTTSKSGKVRTLEVYRLTAKDPPRLIADDTYLEGFQKAMSKHKTFLIHDLYRLGNKYYIPRILKPLVNCSPMIEKFQYYWWRAMSISYAIRPNQRVLAWIDSHRNVSYENAVARSRETSSKDGDTTGTTTKNVVAIYVRRGDKSREMRISPIIEYIDGMRLLWSLNYLNTPPVVTTSTNVIRNATVGTNSSGTLSLSSTTTTPMAERIIFLASESSQVIEEMTEWVGHKNQLQHYHFLNYNLTHGHNNNHSSMSNNHHSHHNEKYDMYYTNVFDRKGLYAEKSAQERDSGAAMMHHGDEYLSMLLNIYHLLQADASVCTMGSNFCRVIDELRATIAGKAGAPYVDLSEEKCEQPPCIYGGFFDLDWR